MNNAIKFHKSEDRYANHKNMAGERLLNSALLSLYGAIFYFIYVNYLSVEWEYTGLRFRALDTRHLITIFLLIALQGYVQPPRLYTPSAPIISLLTLLLYVPAMIITPMAGERDIQHYYGILAALSVSFFTLSYAISNKSYQQDFVPLPNSNIYFGFIFVFFALTVTLLYAYYEIINFVSIDDVYYQRFAAADVNIGGVIGYIRTHYLYVFSSFIFGAGFLKQKYWPMIIIGMIGFFVTYIIDASKISFIIPFIIIGFFAIYRYGNSCTYWLNGGVAAIAILCGILTQFPGFLKIIGDLVLLRAMAIPAQTLVQYADVFDYRGYTWWSHIRGINLLVSPPDSFISDPFWPALGQIVGADLFGNSSRLNLNANPFSGEGVAAAGSFGVLVIGLILAIFFKALDFVSRGWNREFLLLVSVPIGVSLLNSHLSTTLLSFGGGFWLAFLYLGKIEFSASQRPLDFH